MQITWNIETKKKIAIGISIAVASLIILSIGFYIGNRNVRTFFDRYIFRKEITGNNASRIDITDFENPSIYAFDQYITILDKHQMSIYTASRKKRIWNRSRRKRCVICFKWALSYGRAKKWPKPISNRKWQYFLAKRNRRTNTKNQCQPKWICIGYRNRRKLQKYRNCLQCLTEKNSLKPTYLTPPVLIVVYQETTGNLPLQK